MSSQFSWSSHWLEHHCYFRITVSQCSHTVSSPRKDDQKSIKRDYVLAAGDAIGSPRLRMLDNLVMNRQQCYLMGVCTVVQNFLYQASIRDLLIQLLGSCGRIEKACCRIEGRFNDNVTYRGANTDELDQHRGGGSRRCPSGVVPPIFGRAASLTMAAAKTDSNLGVNHNAMNLEWFLQSAASPTTAAVKPIQNVVDAPLSPL